MAHDLVLHVSELHHEIVVPCEIVDNAPASSWFHTIIDQFVPLEVK